MDPILEKMIQWNFLKSIERYDQYFWPYQTQLPGQALSGKWGTGCWVIQSIKLRRQLVTNL